MLNNDIKIAIVNKKDGFSVDWIEYCKKTGFHTLI